MIRLETLEDRLVPALIVNGTEAADAVAFRFDAPSARVQVLVNQQLRLTFAPDQTEEIQVNGLGGNDRFDLTALWTAPAVRARVQLDGGSGDDTLDGSGSRGVLRLIGGTGNDRLIGGAANDELHGDAGNDYLFGNDGNDMLSGAADDDEVLGGNGDDQVYGGTGNDVLRGQAGRDWMQGGAGNDYFAAGDGDDRAFGEAGNDTLYGESGNDEINGGDGNDSLSPGRNNSMTGGNDTVIGGNGSDTLSQEFFGAGVRAQVRDASLTADAGYFATLSGVERASLRGTDGNDFLQATLFSGGVELYGGWGDDVLIGGRGADYLSGGSGVDILVALDNGTGDYLDGGDGADALWMDDNGFSGGRDGAFPGAGDRFQAVASFANGADRTLDGDRIADPIALAASGGYRRFADSPLFSGLPRLDDIRQGNLGDCWLLAALGGLAQQQPTVLRHNVVPFGDGTFGVRLGGSFYRVDDDLPVRADGSLAYAGLGAGGSLWVAVAEKAFASHRTVLNWYESLDKGWPDEAYRAFGGSGQWRLMTAYPTVSAAAQDIAARLAAGQAVSLNIGDGVHAPGIIVNRHAYTVTGVILNGAGEVCLVVRNPWGTEGYQAFRLVDVLAPDTSFSIGSGF